MHEFWVWLWTVLLFAGVGIFSVLSVLVIIFWGRDLVALLTSLRARHREQQAQAPRPEVDSA